MMSSRQIQSFFVLVISTLMVVATVVFNFGTTSAWAATLPAPLTTQPQFAVMNRAEAATTNLEGKAQEAIGNVAGDPKDQIMGKAKQVESQVRNTAEDIKDQVDQVQLPERAQAAARNVEGKLQEAAGNVTGNNKDQMMGRVKQSQSENRNPIETIKDSIGNFFN